jgi:Alba
LKTNRGMSDDENVQTIIIKSHSNISKTVSKCLAILNPKSTNQSNTQPPALRIQADAKVAGKAITITEIVKRRIKDHGQTINQSTQVQEKSAETVVPEHDPGKKHLQGEGHEKPKKKREAQIIIRLDRSGT